MSVKSPGSCDFCQFLRKATYRPILAVEAYYYFFPLEEVSRQDHFAVRTNTLFSRCIDRERHQGVLLMKPAVIALGIGAAALGGYVYFTYLETPSVAVDQAVATPVVDTSVVQDAAAAVEDATETAVEAASEAVETAVETASDAVDATAEAVGETVEAAVDETQEAATQAVEAATEAAGAVADSVTETATDAVETATDAVETATDAVTGTVAGAADEAVTDVATEATESATDVGAAVAEQTDAVTSSAAEVASEAATDVVDGAATTAMDAAAGLLTADGFDLDQVVDLISGSSLADSQKMVLSTAVTQAKDNPALLGVALDQVKSALGL
jgi:hypothetical protein